MLCRGFSFTSTSRINIAVYKFLLGLPNLVSFFQILITELTDLCLEQFLLETIFVAINKFNKLEKNKSI